MRGPATHRSAYRENTVYTRLWDDAGPVEKTSQRKTKRTLLASKVICTLISPITVSFSYGNTLWTMTIRSSKSSKSQTVLAG